MGPIIYFLYMYYYIVVIMVPFVKNMFSKKGVMMKMFHFGEPASSGCSISSSIRSIVVVVCDI